MLNVSEKLQKLQNRAIRVITKSSYDTIVPDFFLARLVETIYWLEGLNKRLIECTSALIIANNLVPAYLCPSLSSSTVSTIATERKYDKVMRQ